LKNFAKKQEALTLKAFYIFISAAKANKMSTQVKE